MLGQILTVEQLAILIHKSPASIRSDASRKPQVLPPICRLPGNKRLLWRTEDVIAWVEKFVQRDPSSYPPEVHTSINLPKGRGPVLATNEPKRRGRPRKTEVHA